MITRPSQELTLADRLSHLTHAQACRLLGPRAKELLREGGALEISLDSGGLRHPERFVLELPGAQVTIEQASGQRLGLAVRCTACSTPCLHAGAALSFVLEEKTLLGLAKPPTERIPIGALGDKELVARALTERQERARSERMVVRSEDPARPWTDYVVTSATSGRSYRVALRGHERGQSYCACPDFRKNSLGTCKHILHVLDKVRERFSSRRLREPYRRTGFSVFVHYADERSLWLGIPARKLEGEVAALAEPFRTRPIDDVRDLLDRTRKLENLGQPVTIYPDAEELIQQRLLEHRLQQLTVAIRKDPTGHPLRRTLLTVELLPYQLDGIAFAAAARRAILADDMGLGKTLQGIGLAELLRRELGIERVLVVCPASLKAQWRSEIERFSGHQARLVMGPAAQRPAQYRSPAFFTVCNYEQVLRDLSAIEAVPWDLVILDEAHRIKNWEAKTSRVIKGLRSSFALALTGTPLENRLDDLYSVVEFIDERRLGPAFRFFNRHRRVNERGKVLGYENLTELRERLAPLLLRRTRDSVMEELPPRSIEFLRVAPTTQQADLHLGHLQTVITVVRKKFISEMDLLRLRRALLGCRMAADSTALVDKRLPGHSSKLERLTDLLGELLAESDRKILLFSEWTSMLDLIEKRLPRLGARWVRLDGSVPQRKRQLLVSAFQSDPECRLFLATNAGSTGLNLQAANTVVNVDLPWNPAVLEQRIGRAHRMGQTRPVQVFVLVTEDTIEENLLATLAAKRELALAVLDPDSQVEAVDVQSHVEELRENLEVLLGAKPETPASAREPGVEAREARRERVASAAGALVSAAFGFLGEVLPPREPNPQASYLGDFFRKQLSECIDEDREGRPTLTVTLPDRSALDALALSLGRILAEHAPGQARVLAG